MNVTGVEWRDLDPHDPRFTPGRRPKRARRPESDQEEDILDLHGEADSPPAEAPGDPPPPAGDTPERFF